MSSTHPVNRKSFCTWHISGLWALGREGWIELACEDCQGQVKACSQDSDISETVFGVSMIVCKKKL